MKFYFAASISGGRQDVDIYSQFIKYLTNFGEVLTEHIGDKDLEKTGEKELSDVEIHDRDLMWLYDADVIVAEVTTPSLGVGYEIARAFEAGKRVVCLYRKQEGKRLSAMITGNKKLEIYYYDNFNEAKNVLDKLFL